MKKKTAISLSILLCMGTLYLLYLDISAGDIGLNLMKWPAILIMSVCQILRAAFTTQPKYTIPEELKEQEDYVLAKNRVNYGSKIGIAGGLMIVIPVVLLLVLKDLHGFWARIAVFSFLGGIPTAVIGLVFFMMGSHYITKTEAKCLMETSAQPEPERKIVTICNVIGGIASIVLLVVILMD